MVDVSISGSGDLIGGLAGEIWFAPVTHCYSTGTVSGNTVVGGLVGASGWGGRMTRCYSATLVSGTAVVGGLVGTNGGDVTQCYSTGSVSGVSDAGGLAGNNSSTGGISNCYATGSVSAEWSVRGLLGENSHKVTFCYSTGAVSGSEIVGGLVGSPNAGDYLGTIVDSCWDIETSGQTTSAGGTGKTTTEMQTADSFLEAGWDFVGETANGTEDIWKISEGLGYPRLWWEKYSGGTGDPNDPYQIATAEDLMLLGESPEDYDKHFILTADIDLDPNLPGRKVFDRAVIAPSSYVCWPEFPACGRVGLPFTGVFDGNNRIISHLTIAGVDYLGLFGYLGRTAEIRALGMERVTVDGTDSYIGGLVGHCAGGTLSRCYSTGTVRGGSSVGALAGATFYEERAHVYQCHANATVVGSFDVGGLVGSNGGTVTQCYSTGVVSGTRCVGGLMGNNGKSMEDGWEGTVTNSYSSSDVSGLERVGGLVGDNDDGALVDCYSLGAVGGDRFVGGLVGYDRTGRVICCYSAGAVSGKNDVGGLVGYAEEWSSLAFHFIACFWDIETSGQVTGADGTGLTTAEMQTAATFLEAGWDFVDETTNGTEDIWWIIEGQDYPRLWWEVIEGN